VSEKRGGQEENKRLRGGDYRKTPRKGKRNPSKKRRNAREQNPPPRKE